MDARAHIVVQGDVQGVGFRYFTFARAQERGLSGFVRNLDDGTVEIVAEGDRSSIEQFLEEVKAGPRLARVTGFRIEWLKPGPEFHEFRIW